MSRPFEFTYRQTRVHGRCINWGRVMRGGLPEGGEPEEGRSEPDLLDADIIEAHMCKMRRMRRLQFKVMKYIYLRGRATIEAANYFRKSDWWVRKRQREGIDYIIRLEGGS